MSLSQIPYVDPDAPPSVGARLVGRVANTELIAAISTTRVWRRFVLRLDALLMRATKGRFSAVALTIPSGLLETTGARSGLARRAPVIYFHDGDLITLVASNAGLPMAPAWYHNLRASPEVSFNGKPFHAAVVEDPAEQARLWQLADRVFPSYASYRARAARAGRVIPIVQLFAD
jgi:deazaflavin-dependent oxidoreductase (nitroreductase family)